MLPRDIRLFRKEIPFLVREVEFDPRLKPDSPLQDIAITLCDRYHLARPDGNEQVVVTLRRIDAAIAAAQGFLQ